MLKRLEVVGFKSFAKKTTLDFSTAVTAIVGPNGSGKSNVAEAFRFALGEQSMKSMRGRRAEDLIWGGSSTSPRGNRAAVSITFENPPAGPPAGGRSFALDFDEVVIERTAHRDGVSEYAINGSKVRLRDVQELLAGANIGETEHHIISQGEADRIMLVSARERRALIEDALGLRIYEFKKREAELKLAKTKENVKEVEAVRRELAPHLRFLSRQVEKLEKADELRRELAERAKEYFGAEDAYLANERQKTAEGGREANERLTAASAELGAIEERAGAGGARLAALREAERELARVRGEKSELARELGRVEGALAAAKERSAKAAREPYAKVPREELSALAEAVARETEQAGATADALKAALAAVHEAVKAFVSRFVAPHDDLMAEEERAAHALAERERELALRERALSAKAEQAESALSRAREALAAEAEEGREERRRLLALAERKAREEAAAATAAARERELALLAGELDRLKAEAVAATGREALSYESGEAFAAEGADRERQEARKKGLERLIIRLEEQGGTDEDIRREHRETAERDAFLARELGDLAQSAEGLAALARDLERELASHFAEGLAKVNASFDEYFKTMFGGGGARLVLEEPEAPEPEDEFDAEESRAAADAAGKPGIEIAVNLPRKKVRSLMQLSGGERALTSIALIFAMSQVNPPPFLILDETDAALDEANSRRYGDMIEALAARSQLIVITHNRETMSRAGVLYGVTMGADGVSKLLSVKFDEAMQVAK